MTRILKSTKFYIGITLIVQSITFLILFIVLVNKKKSIYGALLAVSICGGLAGGWLLVRQLMEEYDKKQLYMHMKESNESFTEDIPDAQIIKEIPVDDTVNEDEFI